MNTDQLLNIHQSYSLTTIKAINQQILIAQYAQCEQISKLQKEIAASNEVLRQILRNQLVDLQYREKMRYYKSLAYSINEAVDVICVESSHLVKAFLGTFFRDALLLNIQEAKENLDDISDKEYCKSVENKIQSILISSDESGDNLSSHLQTSLTEYSELKNRAEQKRIEFNECASKVNNVPKQEKNIKRGCLTAFLIVNALFWLLMVLVSIGENDVTLIFSVFFLMCFIPVAIIKYKDRKSKANHNEYVRNWQAVHADALLCLNQECDDLQRQMEASEYVQILKQVTLESPNLESKVKKIESFIPKVNA